MGLRPFLSKALLVLVAATALAQQSAPPRPPGGRLRQDCAADFVGSERDTWQMPDQVLAALQLKNGHVVADIGAGTGYFALKFARGVAPKGKVYAVDISAPALEYLKKEARKQDLKNIETIVSREDDPLLPNRSVNLAFFCDTIHEMTDRASFYRKVSRALKKRGRMAIIDSPPEDPGSPHEGEKHISAKHAVREAEQAGFRLVQEFKFLPQQYFLLFEKR